MDRLRKNQKQGEIRGILELPQILLGTNAVGKCMIPGMFDPKNP